MHPARLVLDIVHRRRGTYCVNFHVGEFGSPSTIFESPCGEGESLATDRYTKVGDLSYDATAKQKVASWWVSLQLSNYDGGGLKLMPGG